MSVRHVLAVGGMVLAISACGKSSTSPTATPTACSGGNRGSMSAQINGAAWTATCITTASFTGGIVSLGGTDGAQSIGLSISYKGPGAYTLTPIDPLNPPAQLMLASGVVNLVPASSASWTAGSAVPGSSGILNLAGLSATGVNGTFSFTAPATSGTGSSGTKVVSNGAFNVTF